MTTAGIYGAGLEDFLLKALAISVGGSILLEGAALSGAKALGESQTTASKVAKCALAAIALIGAFAATVGLGISAFGFAGCFPSLVCKGLAVQVGYFAGAVVALSAMLIHRKAFQWSGLVTQQGELRDRAI